MTLEPWFFLLGPDSGLKQEFYSEYQAALRRTHPQCDISTCFASEESAVDLVNRLRNGDLFSDARLVKCYNPELWKRKEDQKAIQSYLSSPDEGSSLLFFIDAVAPPAWLKGFEKPSRKKVFWALFDNQKREWIRRYFASKKRGISEDAIELMIDSLSEDSSELKQFCTHVASMCEEGSELGADELEGYLFLAHDGSPYTVFEDCARKRFDKALEKAQSAVMREETVHGIITVLVRQFRKLQVLQLEDPRAGIDERVFTQLGIRGKRQRQLFSEAHRNWTSLQCDSALYLSLCAELDSRLAKPALHPALLALLFHRLGEASTSERREEFQQLVQERLSREPAVSQLL